MRIWIALLALSAPAAAFAAGPDHVSLASHVFVERVRPGPAGKPVTVREAPGIVTPGDKLVFELAYRNVGAEPATGFTITDPIPASVAFAGGESEGALFSVDGGRSWGPLASLRVARPNGAPRAATPADVTHVKWVFARPIPAGAAGSVSFRGVVK
ncbi:MAG: hypothetical protein QOH81_1735 [Sphingomonadales bacterium]|jgi:uncharacterized repeat protein (TIGR01451 family)|nr:hypothetical protein [Sphingomonadales bacterium]